MWEIKGRPVDPLRFAPFEPLHVLNYYDGPRIFTFYDSDGALCLACWSDDGDRRSRFLVAPTSESIIAAMKQGTLSVSKALSQPRLWAVDLSYDGNLLGAWLISPESVPADAQPQPGTMLGRFERSGPAVELPGLKPASTNASFENILNQANGASAEWCTPPEKGVSTPLVEALAAAVLRLTPEERAKLAHLLQDN